MFSEVAKGVGGLFVLHRCNEYIHITYNYINNKFLLPPPTFGKTLLSYNDYSSIVHIILKLVNLYDYK